MQFQYFSYLGSGKAREGRGNGVEGGIRGSKQGVRIGTLGNIIKDIAVAGLFEERAKFNKCRSIGGISNGRV